MAGSQWVAVVHGDVDLGVGRNMVSLVALLLPVVLTGVVLFFASFISWVVIPNHRDDWKAMPGESTVSDAIRSAGVPPGNYAFPYCAPGTPQAEHAEKANRGPMGVLTVFPGMSMGRNLGLTLVSYLVVSFCLAYLGTLGLKPGATFREVFRFFATASVLTFLTGILQHAIWFRARVVGHVLESVVYAALVGTIFGAFWPAA